MRANRYNWLKKNPLVLLIRRIYRFFNSLLQPKKRLSRSHPQYQIPGDKQNNSDPLFNTEVEILEAEIHEVENELITIGQLFEKVRWQDSPPKTKTIKPRVTSLAQPDLKNQKHLDFVPVGELLKQVKWRVPPAIIQEQFLNTSRVPQTHDVSRN